jgi:hypothetical protein
MGSFWESFILNNALLLLTSLKKDPSNVPVFKTVLQHVVTDCCELLQVQPPTFQ